MAVRDMLMAAAGVSTGAATYVDDVFSTYLYTGNGSTQVIENGIDLENYAGMMWLKDRTAANRHMIFDTKRYSGNYISSNNTDAQVQNANTLSSYFNGGFEVGNSSLVNTSSNNYVSWTFRKQEKFFDVVTYTGNGNSPRAIAHSLGSVPGCIIVKRTDTTSNWNVYHRSLGADYSILLNLTNDGSGGGKWAGTSPTSTDFYVSSDSAVNASGGTYVAYIFAHNAGGFGSAGTDNVISCGSFTTDASGVVSVNLGYEPQFLLVKKTSGVGNWIVADNMRGMLAPTGNGNALYANTSGAESTGSSTVPQINATGFSYDGGTAIFGDSATGIYIAIRRPMKPPTAGTEVFSPVQSTSTTSTSSVGFVDDLVIAAWRDANDGGGKYFSDRLRGSGKYFSSTSTAAESSGGSFNFNTQQYGISGTDTSGGVYPFLWMFKRAPGFFDEVCYTGTGSATTQAHNLGVAPEFVIIKSRSIAGADWQAFHKGLNGGTNPWNYSMYFNGDGANFSYAGLNNTAPTTSVFSLGTNGGTNQSGSTYVAYLFATLAGVSKVGSYTGTGTTNSINCGFTGGARFVMIKRTDSTGDWYVWDTARGIVSGNDPYLLLDSTAAEVTSTDYIDPLSSGFQISSSAPAAINANGGSFIYLAIS